jgi:hypothetical protein
MLAFILLSLGCGFLPVVDHLPHPTTVKVQFEDNLQIPLNLNLAWYDEGLNTNGFFKQFPLPENHTLELPSTGIPTQLWKYLEKRILTPFDKWTACENCYGPNVDISVSPTGGYQPPEAMRLTQSQVKTGQQLIIKVTLIPDEKKAKPRDFKPGNLTALLTEAIPLIKKGKSSNIPRTQWGPELAQINPARVECQNGALVLWMGGKAGYVLVPDSTSCPAFNMAWVSGTEFRHVFKITKI